MKVEERGEEGDEAKESSGRCKGTRLKMRGNETKRGEGSWIRWVESEEWAA